MNKILLFSLLCITLLSSCSSRYVFNSDLSNENTRQYFSASHVTIYANEQSINASNQYLGLIEGEDCQIKAHLALPDKVNARTQARQLAYDQGANGIVFTQCVDIKTKHCLAQIVCYGKMYQVSEVKDKR